jgi:hypothetical protein
MGIALLFLLYDSEHFEAQAVDYYLTLKRSTHPVETLVGGHMCEYDVTNLLHPLSGFGIDF